MYRAFIHGKLSRSQENMEDLLTSMVFGTLEHLPPELTAAFLRGARTPEGALPLGGLATPRRIRWTFWPWVQAPGAAGCEPDVFLELFDDHDNRVVVFIEVKLRSGKSSHDDGESPTPALKVIPTRDQLAREWENASFAAGGDRAIVIYTTPDIVFPDTDLTEAQAELDRKGHGRGQLAWVSLRALHPLLDGVDYALATSLRQVMIRLDLVPFNGISAPRRTARATWVFERFTYSRRAPRPSWTFGGQESDQPEGSPQ